MWKRAKELGKQAYELAKATIDAWLDDDAPTYAAAVAFYAMISLAPVLTIVVKIVSMVFTEEIAQQRLLYEVERYAGVHVANVMESILEAMAVGSSGTMATIISIGVIIFGATGVFAQLHTALNRIWGLETQGGISEFFRVRLRAIGIVFGVGALLMVSIFLSTLVSIFTPFLATFVGTKFLWQLINFVLSFGVLTVLFAMIYRYLPDTTIAWRDTWLGAATTSILFVIGKLLIGLYLSTAAPGSAYGAAGSLVAFLLWVFYSAQVILIGAEFTQVYASFRGRNIVYKSTKQKKEEN